MNDITGKQLPPRAPLRDHTFQQGADPFEVPTKGSASRMPDGVKSGNLAPALPTRKPVSAIWKFMYRVFFLVVTIGIISPRTTYFLDGPEKLALVKPVVEAAARVMAEGQLSAYPDAIAQVGTDLAGTIVKLNVQEAQTVRKGDVIAELRADDFRAALREERAALAEVEAEIRLAENTEYRAKRLQASHLGSDSAADQAERDYAAAVAKRTLALARIEHKEALLAKTRILAPFDGTVIERKVNLGDTVTAGTIFATIVDLKRTRIESEVDEFDIGRIRLGEKVKVTAESFPGKVWEGQVSEIPESVVARRLRPQDPSRMVDSRVLLVKVQLLGPSPLKIGQRLELNFENGAESGLAKQ